MPPANPPEWRDRLIAELDRRWSELRVYDAYYEGDQELAFITKKYRDAYGSFFRGLTDNWMPLVVDASVERLWVQGFRFGNEEADSDAWELWQESDLDAESHLVHTEAVKLGWAYWLVQPMGRGANPRITGEHPSQVIVATEPGNRHERLAALKRWADEDFIYANVYLPDRVIKYRTTQRKLTIMEAERRWETVGAESNPLGVVPIVPVPNNPSMIHGAKSDLAGGPISIQDSINLLLSGMLIGAEYMAYPLRVMLGVDTPRDPATGDPIPNAELKIAQSRLLMFPGDAREMDIKEFSPADLGNFRESIDGLVRDLTAQTRTPPHYVSGQIVNASGDALKAAETGLVAKVRGKMVPFGEAHEETTRLGFLAKDPSDERAQAFDCETIWRDPESRSQAETVDAAVKLSTIGVPQEALWERIGASPQEIERWREMAKAEEAAKPEPPPIVVAPNGAPPEEQPTLEQPTLEARRASARPTTP